MRFLQDLVHKTGIVGGSRFAKSALAILSALLLTLIYDLRAYKNMSTQEAMDAAQLGRNLAEGRGYTTLFIRPFSMYLVQRANRERLGPPRADSFPDYARIRQDHPDISNAPFYPLMLAGLMKVLPFDYTTSETKPFWSSDLHFWRYQPDFLIALFNQGLFLATIALAFFWARRLFDQNVAWISTVLLLGTDVLWRFSVSGLSTMLLLLIFMSLVWCLTLVESGVREANRGEKYLFALSAAVGLLIGLGSLTRYAFMWVLIPTLVFLVLFGGPKRAVFCLAVIAVFAAVLVPWAIRNVNLSGSAFGTATYHPLEGTMLFPEYRLERSLEPNIRVVMKPLWMKLLTNTRAILQGNFFNLGGGWITALFLAGLMVGFRNQTARRIRYFLMSTLAMLVIVQALGLTQLAEDSPEINSENLLVLLTPIVLIYGVSFFFVLLEQVKTPFLFARYLTIGLFAVLACLPMLFSLLPPRTNPTAYPPYRPPQIQQVASWMEEKELVMSDVPWAVAWYGHRQSVWLTLNATRSTRDPHARENFSAIHDYQKPISALYLTTRTLDSRFLSEWLDTGELSWGSFVTTAVLMNKIPDSFPLQETRPGFSPRALFLTDRMHARKAEDAASHKAP